MNALDSLKRDHQNVAQLFQQAETNASQQVLFFNQIASELEIHTYLEEKIFYPALKAHDELKDLVTEAYQEHQEVKTLLNEMRNHADTGKFNKQLQELKENVEHHVEEEENEMFPQVERVFDQSQLEELGQQIEEAKQQYQQKKAASTNLRL